MHDSSKLVYHLLVNHTNARRKGDALSWIAGTVLLGKALLFARNLFFQLYTFAFYGSSSETLVRSLQALHCIAVPIYLYLSVTAQCNPLHF